MESATSATILRKLKETSEKKREEHYRNIDTIARTMGYNLEAIVKLIELSGELHIDLCDESKVFSIIEPYYKADDRVYYKVSHAASTVGMDIATGSARIYPHPETGEDAVRVVAVFKFKRDFLIPSLLPELLALFNRYVRLGDRFGMIDIYAYPRAPGVTRIENGGWDIETAIRDNSIIITLY